jgi:hypothetical protein
MIMASSTLTASLSPAPTMDHQDMDAVSALLGVSPSRTNGLLRGSTWTSSSTVPEPTSHGFSFAPARIVSLDEPSSSPYMTASGSHDSGRSPESVTLQTRPRSNSAGLDALALLASKEQAKYENTKLQKEEQPSSFESFILSASPSSSSDDDDSESMPPPAPRGRRRSASNPEGMEKWDSLSVGRNQHRNNSCRRHFMLPDYVLAEELAEASAAIEAHGRKPPRTIPEHAEYEEDPADNFSISQDEEIEENLTPAELLRRARSRLLEDLSEGNISGDKGVVTLPHSLPKYKEVSATLLCSHKRVFLDIPQRLKYSFSYISSVLQQWSHRNLHT